MAPRCAWQARGERLGSFQRKFPTIGVALLYVLAFIELFAFPLLGAGTAGLSELPELPTVSILELQVPPALHRIRNFRC